MALNGFPQDEWANFALKSKLNINGYNRDSLVAIGNTLVENSFKTPERHRNKYAVRYASIQDVVADRIAEGFSGLAKNSCGDVNVGRLHAQ